MDKTRMKDSCADRRTALETISCSSEELNVHCAASSGRPLNAMDERSKLIGGGGMRAVGLGMDLMLSFGSGEDVSSVVGSACTPTSIVGDISGHLGEGA